MTAHIIAVEGPIYDELLVHRMARAHGFQRSAARIREVVLGSVEQRFPRSAEEGRTVFWPIGSEPSALAPFRMSRPEIRDHASIPLAELASLAQRFIGEGADTEETVRRMAAEFALGRLREATRARFEAAAALAGRPADPEVRGTVESDLV